MALRLRRALSLSYSLLHHSLHQPKPLPSISSSIFSTPVSASGPSAAVNHSFAQSTRAFTSTSTLFAKVFDPETDEIGPDTILFEGCDYEHWLITVDFSKDSNLTREQMIETYVNIAAQVFGSVEEAKKKIYALSTTTYQGFQVLCSEETSEKFKDVPGVVFVLPDSYIDTVNKEYGGDKYINGEIIPRPPPVHYGRHENRGRRGRQEQRWSREQQNYGPPPQQQNFGPPPQQQNFGPPPQQQNYRLPPQQQNYGPPPQQQNYGPSPQQNYKAPPQQNHGPPSQQNHGPQPQQNYGPPPQQNYGPPPQQSYGPPPPQQNYGPLPQQNYVPQGHQGYRNTTSYRPQQNYGPSPQQNHGPSPQQNFVPQGYQGYGNPPSPPPPQNYGPQGSGDQRSFTSPGNSNVHQGNYNEGQRDFQQGNFQSDFPQGTGYGSSSDGGFEQAPVGALRNFSSTGNN